MVTHSFTSVNPSARMFKILSLPRGMIINEQTHLRLVIIRLIHIDVRIHNLCNVLPKPFVHKNCRRNSHLYGGELVAIKIHQIYPF